ncbi:hypothetical protein ECANGB1_2623 [Enterospora canceri]|uniref:Uncharacterized protein n=1 Tax=Enterospora canceri TaxID=1081671 RepID=A0A1Y1S9F3_9MICR|nr:hypothetical protein ECANGB1_2623 [Enterospora canceri]
MIQVRLLITSFLTILNVYFWRDSQKIGKKESMRHCLVVKRIQSAKPEENQSSRSRNNLRVRKMQ